MANQAGVEKVVRLALTASQNTSDEEEGGNQASAAEVRSSLWRLCTQATVADPSSFRPLGMIDFNEQTVQEAYSQENGEGVRRRG